MAVLAIDTSGSFCSVAVSAASGVISLCSSSTNDHFERLPNMVGEVFERASINPSDLNEIRIGLGPGSFTGLRIGMSFAKGLACSLRIPVHGYSSFAAMAARVFHGDSSIASVVVVADARRDEVFIARYARSGGVEVEPSIAAVGALSEAPWYISGQGTRVVSPQGDLTVGGVAPMVERECARGLLLLPEVVGGAFSVGEISVMEPTYLRAVAAKTIAERKMGA